MEECLVYFRQAIANPVSVPPWSEWWTANGELVERVFPLFDFVRLKHRRLLGARQILQRLGELPADYQPLSPLVTGSCSNCGERFIGQRSPTDGLIRCPVCEFVCTEDGCAVPLKEASRGTPGD